jgi:hypothetical protein
VVQDDEMVSGLKEKIMELESEGERKEAAFQQTLGVKEAEITELQERIR